MTPDEGPGPPTPPLFRCGYVAIIGEPNVGKSTLMNGLLQQKISIVTKKPQTTRHKILGILTTPAYQAVFLDTPGIIQPRYALHEAMMESAASAVSDADLILFMVDAARPAAGGDSPEDAILAQLAASARPVYLVLNKVDLVDKGLLLPLIDRYSRRHPFREIFPVSALTLEGTGGLMASVSSELPVHPPLYPADIVSESNERFFVAEIIREKIFIRCQEEVPYSTTVEITEFIERGAAAEAEAEPPKNRKPVKWFISADIYVERDSQKGILIGKKGGMLKEIGENARRDIERFLGHQVFLDLHVRVRAGWRGDREWIQRLGYR
jgi:GTP-binding protein Era